MLLLNFDKMRHLESNRFQTLITCQIAMFTFSCQNNVVISGLKIEKLEEVALAKAVEKLIETNIKW